MGSHQNIFQIQDKDFMYHGLLQQIPNNKTDSQSLECLLACCKPVHWMVELVLSLKYF